MITGLRFGWGGTTVPIITGGPLATPRSGAVYHASPYCNGSGAPNDRAQSKGHEVVAMSDIGERVKKIVVEHLGVEADKVTENASFIDDLGADSLDTVELVMAFEEEFQVEIPDDAAETIQTVGDAIRFLESHSTKA